MTTVSGPTALAFLPDGRMLITSHFGTLWIYDSRTGQTTSALTLTDRICSDQERGLLGVAVDPNFASDGSSGFIYLYYTFKKHGVCELNSSRSPVNRVSKFVLTGGTVDPASETILIDNIPQPGGIHSAGDLEVGKDGNLYISSGDGGCDLDNGSLCGFQNDNARQRHILLGKILRITRDGGIPASNPYQGAGTARCNLAGQTTAGLVCQETFAEGLRNPFRFAFDPNGSATRFHIDDTGQDTWEEINLGQAGADYGWNVREGHCARNSTTDCGTPPSGLTNPIYDYQHNNVFPTGSATACNAITGGAFVPNGIFPSAYEGSYLYSDFTCGTIFRLMPSGSGGFTRTEFVTGLGNQSAVVMKFGPHAGTQALYYTTYNLGGQIRRVSFTGTTNRAPVARATANPASGAVPLTVAFDGRASSDPDGDSLTYTWDFGDGSAAATGSQVTHRYTPANVYTASLTVGDGRGRTATTNLRIDAGNTAPIPTITAPATDLQFRVGQTMTLTGSATDSEDGNLPDSALSWVVLRHHDTHTHPFLGPLTGNNISFAAPAPEDLAAATTSYLEIQLTATDSAGLSRTVTQAVMPHKVDATFTTEPAGLRLEVDAASIAAPRTLTSWEGFVLSVNAPAQTDGSGRAMEFVSWSDGGAAAHTVMTPVSPATYTATFRVSPVTTLTVAPNADARVNESNPSTNFGTSTALRADGGSDPDVETYLRFTVSGVSGPVQSAKLRIFATSGTANGPAVYTTGTNWTETGITWATRPAVTSAARDDKGSIGSNVWVEYDVTPFIVGNTTYSFVLRTTSNDGIDFFSRQNSTNRPELVVTFSGSSDIEPPKVPTNLTATAASATRVDLAWSAPTDNIGVTGYEILRNGSFFTTVGAQTTYSDTTVLPSTTYQYQVGARDAAGNASPLSAAAGVSTPAGTSTTTLTVAPNADARVNESNPSTNFGTSTALRADGGSDPDVETYLRFTVSGVSGPVQSAKLRIFATSGTANGPAVYTTGTNWTETGITWATRPAVTSAARDDKGSIGSNVWVEYDVTPFIVGNTTYSFVLRTTSNDGIDFFSRQNSTNRPELVVTFSGS